MPGTNQNSLLRLDIYQKIIQGKYTANDQSLTIFEKFLNILNQLPPCPTKENTVIGRPVFSSMVTQTPPCIKAGENPLLRQPSFFQDLLKDNQLVNSFKYLKSVIDQQTNNIKPEYVQKLVELCDDFFKVPLIKLNLTVEEMNAISREFFGLFESISNLSETIHIHARDKNDRAIFNLIHLSAGYFNQLQKLNGNISMATESSNLTYSLFEPLKSYLGGLGNLILHFRNAYPEADLSQFENNAVKLVNSMNLLTPDELGSARWTFLSQYHAAADLLKECKRLFNTTICDPYNFNTEFKLIGQGKSVNNSPSGVILKKLLFGSEEEIKERLKSLSITKDRNNGLVYYQNYLKTTIKEANRNGSPLSADYLKDISLLTFYLTDVFKETRPKSNIYDSLFSLVLTLLKNPSINDHQFWHIWKAIEACANQMKALLETPQPGIDSSMNILTDIFHQVNNIAAVSPAEKQEIGKIIAELSLSCLNVDSCDSFSAINQFSKTLGALFRGLSKKNQTQHETQAAQAIEASAQQIIRNATDKLSEPELKGLAWAYLKGRFDRKDGAYASACKKIFNLTDCREFIASNGTMEIEEDIPSATTLIPEEITHSATSTPAPTSTPQISTNATIAPAINQTTPAVIVDPIPATELPGYSNSTIPFNQTVETIRNRDDNSALVSGESLTAVAGHSVISGTFNAWARHFYPNQPTLVIVGNTVLATGVPLGLLAAEQYFGTDTQDQTTLTWWDMAWQMPADFTGALLANTALYYATGATNDLSSFLSNYPILQSAVKHTVPFVTTVASIIKKPVETAVYVVASTTTSVSASGFFNRFWPRKKTDSSDVEAANEPNCHEMQKLNEAKDIHPTANDIATTELVISKKIPFFITDEQFYQIKNTSEKILNELAQLVCSLEHIIENNRAEIKPHTIPAIANTYQKIIDDKSKVHSDLQGILELKLYPASTKSIWEEIMEFLNDDHKDAHIEFIIKNIYTLDEIKNVLQKVYKESVSLELSNQPKIKHSFSKFTSEIETIKNYINSSQNIKNSSSNSDLIFTTNEKNIIQAMEKLIQQTSISAIEKLGNVFKLLVPKFSDMKLTLSTTLGFVQGANSSFTDSDTLDKLTTISKDIQSLLSSAGIYLSKYNTLDAGNQGEQKGKILARTELFEKIAQNTTANTLRPKKTRNFFDNRPQSMASDSRTHSSGSEADSAISTGSSKDEENAQIVRPLLQV